MTGYELGTFSIVARCPASGRLGVAVATALPAVGALCPFVRAGVGAASTQSWTNPYLAIRALELLAAGRSAAVALETVIAADAERALRQIGLVDAAGGTAAWTGTGCTGWCGHLEGAGFTIQGNMLVGEAPLAAMAEAFEADREADLAERLLRALEAGDAAGGDKRGKQSAALKVHDREDYPWLDLRVDEHARPVAELRRVHDVARAQLLPFIEAMPRHDGTPEPMDAEERAMIDRPPPQRPGGARGR